LAAGCKADVVVLSTVPVALIRRARTTYPVIAEPPLLTGAAHRAVALIVPPATPEDAVPITGAPGTVAGVTVFDDAEAGLEPAALAAVTVK